MKKIEIVTHCYAVDRPWYAALLCYQLSSFLLHRHSKCKLIYTICCSVDDYLVRDVLNYFSATGDFVLNRICVDVERLGKRAIDRNLIAKSTVADIVWFTDPDYIFGEDCLDALATMEWPEEAVLVFPGTVFEQYQDKLNIPFLKKLCRKPTLADVYPEMLKEQFFVKKFQRAIGSIQIVQGDFAREHGYCPDKKAHQTPIENPFDNYQSVSDRTFRGQCKKASDSLNFQQAIDLPNVIRLSHPHRKYSPEEAKVKYGW